MTGKEYKKLKSKLPRGYVRILIERTGFSSATISRALRGDKFNKVIIDAAVKLAAENQEEIALQQNKIKKL